MSRPVGTVESQNLQLVYEVIRAWNNHDPDRYVAVLADEFVAEIHGCHSLVRGCDGARKRMQAWFNAFPDLHFAIEGMAASGELVVNKREATGTLRHQCSSSPTLVNRPLEAHGCTVVTLRHGAIVRTWTYWDSDVLLQHVEE